MNVTIGLGSAEFEWLMHTAGSRSRVFSVLKRSADADDWLSGKSYSKCVVIECDLEEAKALLELASHHRPQAMRDIQYGLTAAGL